MSAQGTSDRGLDRDRGFARESESVETKPSFKTTELIIWAVTVIGILLAAWLVDGNGDGEGGFGAVDAWRYVAYVSIGYMVSRGLAKAGSRQPRDS